MHMSVVFSVVRERSQESQPIGRVGAAAPAARGAFPVASNSTDRGDSPPAASAASVHCAQKPRGTGTPWETPPSQGGVPETQGHPTGRLPPCRRRSVQMTTDQHGSEPPRHLASLSL